MDDLMPEREEETKLHFTPLNEENGDEKISGGLITNFISNLVSPSSSPKSQKGENEAETTPNGDYSKSEEEEEDDVDDEKKGGLITNFLSNLVSPSSPKIEEVSTQNGEIPNGVPKIEVENEKEVKKPDCEKENDGGGGGIIDTIVSHFPTSIPDDVVPTADEACILIHSLVKD